MVIEWVHAHHLAVIGVLTLQNDTTDLFTGEQTPVCNHISLGFQMLLHSQGTLTLQMASTRGRGLEVDIFIVSYLLLFLLNTQRDELQ